MKFSLDNNISNLENVRSKFSLLRRRCQEGNGIRKRITRSKRISRNTNHIGLVLQSTRLPRPSRSISPSLTPLQSSLNEPERIEIDQGETSPKIDNTKGNQMQEIISMILSGNKDKIQNVTTKEEYFNIIKELKNLGEKLFDDNGSSSSNVEKINDSSAMIENHQLATPSSTPMDNAFLDESVLSTSLSQNKIDNAFASVLPNLTLPSPEIFSPIQQNVCGSPFIQTPFDKPEDLIASTPFIQSTPFDKPEDLIASTPFIQSTPFNKADDVFSATPFVPTTPFEEIITTPFIPTTPFNYPEDVVTTPLIGLQDTSIVAQDELNPFKTPAPVLGQNSIVGVSPIISNITSPIEDIMKQPQIATPLDILSDFNNNNNTVPGIKDVLSEITGNMMTNSVINSIQESPFQGPSESFFLTTPSIQTDATPMQSPFIFPPEATPLLTPEDSTVTDINNDLLAECNINGTSLLGTNATTENDNTNVIADDTEGLAKVNDLLLEVLNTISDEDSIKNAVSDNLETVSDDKEFPSDDVIKNCQVKENEFNFTNENITKLVRLSPVEVVQEDVVELEKLSKLKRGKGRPRKPRKFSICPFVNCQKKFNREFNLKEHIRIHNPNRSKEFTCNICNESFFSSSVLSRHVASIHEGEKFICKNCGKSFNRKDALHRHEKTSCQMI